MSNQKKDWKMISSAVTLKKDYHSVCKWDTSSTPTLPVLKSGVDFTSAFWVDMLHLARGSGTVSVSSLLLLVPCLQLIGWFPQFSRILGNLKEITALVLSAIAEMPLSVNLLPVEESSATGCWEKKKEEKNGKKKELLTEEPKLALTYNITQFI